MFVTITRNTFYFIQATTPWKLKEISISFMNKYKSKKNLQAEQAYSLIYPE